MEVARKEEEARRAAEIEGDTTEAAEEAPAAEEVTPEASDASADEA